MQSKIKLIFLFFVLVFFTQCAGTGTKIKPTISNNSSGTTNLYFSRQGGFVASGVLAKIKVVIYFLDENGNPFLEKAGFPISEYSFDLNILKPNYTYRMDKGNYNVFDNLGDEWSGKVKIEIVDIEFAE